MYATTLAYDIINPLKPKIKIQIVICCPYTIPIEVVGKNC